MIEVFLEDLMETKDQTDWKHQWERSESDEMGVHVDYKSRFLALHVSGHQGLGLAFVVVTTPSPTSVIICQLTFSAEEARQFADDLIRFSRAPPQPTPTLLPLRMDAAVSPSDSAVLDEAVAGMEQKLGKLLSTDGHQPTAYAIYDPVNPIDRYGASIWIAVACSHCRSLCTIELQITDDNPAKDVIAEINQRLVLMMLRVAPSIKRVAMSDLKWSRHVAKPDTSSE